MKRPAAEKVKKKPATKKRAVPRATAVQKYAAFRATAYQLSRAAFSEFLDGIKIEFTAIHPGALQAWRETWLPISKNSPPEGGWNWADIMRGYRNEPKRFEAAVWVGDTLCGLAAGKSNDTVVCINYMEGFPAKIHPLKGNVALACLDVASWYGQLFDATEVRVVSPANDELINFYNTLGLTLVRKRNEAPYLYRYLGERRSEPNERDQGHASADKKAHA